jgi:hypothetical protein
MDRLVSNNFVFNMKSHLEIQMPLDQELLVLRFGSFQDFIKVVDDVEVDSHGRRYQNFPAENFMTFPTQQTFQQTYATPFSHW